MYALVWKAEIWKILTFASTFERIKKEAWASVRVMNETLKIQIELKFYSMYSLLPLHVKLLILKILQAIFEK